MALKNVLICVENMNVQDADVEDVLSVVRLFQSNFEIVRAADSYVLTVHILLSNDHQKTARNFWYFSGQPSFFLRLL